MSKQSVSKTTPPITDDQLSVLQTLIPQAFTEGKIDPEKLRVSLGDIVDDRPERYSFSWAGKRDAIRLLQVPSRATLIPCPEESLNADGTACHCEPRAERVGEAISSHQETLHPFGALSDRQSQNLFIEGDNLEVLKLLYKPYFGRVKMIYIDPPYNTGNDFVYPDNFADPLDTYLKLTGQKDSAGNLLTSNPETSGRYHSAWLSMMYPRLFLARQLLTEDGVIFISIDDHEAYNLRLILNEVFGEENFVGEVAWKKSSGSSETDFSYVHESIVIYKRSLLYLLGSIPYDEKTLKLYNNPDSDPRGPWASADYTAKWTPKERPTLSYQIQNPFTRNLVYPNKNRVWNCSPEVHEKNVKENRVWWGLKGELKVPRYKRFLSDMKGVVPRSLWDDVGTNEQGLSDLLSLGFTKEDFDNPKPVSLVKRMLQITTRKDTNDLVFDFFAGSCTTAQAVLELNREDGGNRRFIMVQLPEPTGNKKFPTIAEIGKERIRRVVARMKGVGADGSRSIPAGGRPPAQAQLPLDTRPTPEDLGFKVFKLAPSNYRQWDATQPDAAAFARQAEMFADPLVEGWQPENVLYEVALKEGYGLNILIEPVGADGVRPETIFRITDPDKGQFFYLTLVGKIALDDLRPLYLKKDDLFICRDAALDDEAAANLALQCRLKTI